MIGVLRLNHGIDEAAAARAFATEGRVRIEPFLEENAAPRLEELLTAPMPWVRVFLHDGVHRVADADGLAAMPTKMAAVRAAAQPEPNEFGYTYDNIPIYDVAHAKQDHPLVDVFAFLNSPAVLSLLRTVMGTQSPCFLDAQATRFRPGDFLSAHDDAVPGKRRRAAYVLGMTRRWPATAGGALRFRDDEERWLPGFNVLSVFRVPTRHEVERVAPNAPDRLSVTGWVRAGTDPGPGDARGAST